ncbi:RelA/SpoT domain-containing protein [Sphingomonas sp. JC676]|uniref:RelA/SpoT domain-containing protein n=1 Tax=Sphingomonas sp. JC676 TaxID=2768065 RepID=UPI00165861BB|nr:RelA/SpoT domain-containing protein [Sphingomonas sp. JC676]MBC9033008.1 RelA/SpoT domain-containing protein [Sphingomonas sp. JC676]
MTIEGEYQARHDKVLVPLAASLSDLLAEHLGDQQRIDRIGARAKSVDRFVAKSRNVTDQGVPKYEYPLAQIQDQIGARVTVFYKSDVVRVREVLMRYLRPVESRDLVPASEWEFGYFGWHSVCLFPAELIMPDWPAEHVPNFLELQVKTLFQHAWSEANHDLGYKPEGGGLISDQNRMLAFASAQAWGADRAFDELFCGLHDPAKVS